MTTRILLWIRPVFFTFCLIYMLLTLLSPALLFAEEIKGETVQTNTENSPHELTGKNNQQRWAAFPIIASSPETGLMLGGMLFHFFPTDTPDQQASTIDMMVYGTTEGQYALSVSPNIFYKDGTYRLNSSFYGNYWQANYYQIGNDSPDIHEEYDSTNYGASLTVEKRCFDSFILDLIGHYEKTDMDILAGGMLDSGNIPGAEDGEYIGAGLAFGYDTRDNTNAPAKGLLTRYEHVIYDEDIGSSLDFKIQTFDLRYYTYGPIIKDSVLALATQIKSARGDVPFRYLPTPDGTNILRGIENGRYKDNQMLSLQAEYRFPIYAKLSGTVFAEFSQVADDYSDMKLDETKTSIGSGIRYALNPEQHFNIRADIAWVDDGIGLIINVREAF